MARVLLLHGVMSHSGWFAPLGERLAAQGIALLGVDRRGAGQDPLGRGDAESAKQLVEDVLAVHRATRQPERPLFLGGWCWGAVLALNVLPELEGELAGLLLLAPGLHPTPLLKARMEQSLATHAGARQDDPCLESPIPEELFTRGPALESFVRRDPARLSHFTPRFHQLMGRLAMGATLRLPRLRLPTLLLLAEHDRATDNAATRQALGRATQLTTRTVPGEHGLMFDAPEETAAALGDFVRANAGRRA